jgi:hypothetical protein
VRSSKGVERTHGKSQGEAAPTVLMKPPTSSQTGEDGQPGRRPAPRLAGRLVRRFFQRTKQDRPRRLLFLDDDPRRAEIFLIENPQAVWVQTVEECLAHLRENWDEVHLDHDLGGKTHVDMNQVDCGMEIIRWMCKEPRAHLHETDFFVHTHNSLAGLLMVLQMRASGYKAEFRPFAFDLARMLARHEPDPADSVDQPGAPGRPRRRWLDWLRSRLKGRQPAPETRRDPE